MTKSSTVAQPAPIVVVGIDGSEDGRSALDWGAGEAHVRGAILEVLHAWDAPAQAISVYGPAPIPVFAPGYLERRATALAQAASAEVHQLWPDLPIAISVARGHAADALLYASRRAALVVVGGRGLGGFTDLLLGSTSEYLVSHARCPVVVVRAPSDPSVD